MMEYDDLITSYISFNSYYSELLQMNNPKFYDKYCKKEELIKQYYKKHCGVVYHISNNTNLDIIRPSSNYDMYGGKLKKAVFATSNPYEIWLYAGRSIAGEMHEKNRICIYSETPFSYYKDGFYYLKKNVAIYALEVENFVPVLNQRCQENKYKICFDNEWICTKEIVPLKKYVIEKIPGSFTNYYAVYYLDNIRKYPDTKEELEIYIEKHMIKKVEGKL